VAAAVLASLAAEIFCANGLRLPMGRLSMLVCCVFGFVCYRYERNELSDKHFAIAFVILTAAIFANLLVGMALFPSDHPTSTFVMARQSWFLAGVIFFAAYFTRNSPLWRDPRISFIGRISYSIYLVHPIVLYVFSFTAVTGLVLIVLVFGITIALSALAYQFIEAPPIRFGHALRARQGRVMAETRGA
jgi:peptidoglycan/LPS O-acetylase OafA/YrhL